MNITHQYVHKRAIKKRAVKMAILDSGKSNMNLFSQRNQSVQNHLYKSTSLLEQSARSFHHDSTHRFGRKELMPAGVPKQLPSAFSRKISVQQAHPHKKLIGFKKFEKTSVQLDVTPKLNLSQLMQYKNFAVNQNERKKMLTERDTPIKSNNNLSNTRPLKDEEDDFSMENEMISHVNMNKVNKQNLFDNKN